MKIAAALTSLAMIATTGCLSAESTSSSASADGVASCANVPENEQTFCAQCIDHPPRGLATLQACDSEARWAASGLCCATTQADGSCVATYSSTTSHVTATCGAVM